MKRYARRFFGYASGLGLIVASPKITEYMYDAYNYFGGIDSLPFLDHSQSVNLIKYGIEALIVYMGVKLIVDS